MKYVCIIPVLDYLTYSILHTVHLRYSANRPNPVSSQRIPVSYYSLQVRFTIYNNNYLCTCDLYGPVHSDSDACQYSARG